MIDLHNADDGRLLVSIIVRTCAGRGGLLMECLRSIDAQEYRNIEIVVVEDGSAESQSQKLTALGCQVEKASNHEGLLAALEKCGDQVVLLDATSLGDEGPAFVERVNRQSAGARHNG